jgi:hypothetical protein
MKGSPGGQRDQFNRGLGGRGPQGIKPMMGGMNMGNYGPRGNQGMMQSMQWGPMMMPPAPPRGPPKVIELQREEVKLHKAENAWKPGAIKQRTGAGEKPPNDDEEAITQVSTATINSSSGFSLIIMP